MNSDFAKPREGIHRYRDPIFDLAIVDIVLTLVLAYIITIYSPFKNLLLVFLFLVIISILIHKCLNIKTKLLDYLHLN